LSPFRSSGKVSATAKAMARRIAASSGSSNDLSLRATSAWAYLSDRPSAGAPNQANDRDQDSDAR
jgi:hypothetical protein